MNFASFLSHIESTIDKALSSDDKPAVEEKKEEKKTTLPKSTSEIKQSPSSHSVKNSSSNLATVLSSNTLTNNNENDKPTITPYIKVVLYDGSKEQPIVKELKENIEAYVFLLEFFV